MNTFDHNVGKRRGFAILLCLSGFFGCAGQEFIEHKPALPIKAREINWIEYSESALATSKVKKKAALLYFYDDSSGSKLMERKTMSDPEIAYFINENFVPFAINGKLDKYKIKRLPMVLVLSSIDNSEILRLEHAMSAEELLGYLQLIVRVNSLTETMNKMLNFGDFGMPVI